MCLVVSISIEVHTKKALTDCAPHTTSHHCVANTIVAACNRACVCMYINWRRFLRSLEVVGIVLCLMSHSCAVLGIWWTGLETDVRCQRQRLCDLLMMPVQHLMRYVLHLKSMHKTLPDDCPEKDALETTIAFVNGCVTKVNDTQADIESTTQLLTHLKEINAEVCFKLGREFVECIKGNVEFINGRLWTSWIVYSHSKIP